jgi:hypothetical protein
MHVLVGLSLHLSAVEHHMPIEYRKWIKRTDVRREREKVFVFGDNVRRAGFGGQAKEMRGEKNAVGVATKWAPSMMEKDFFTDSAACFCEVDRDLLKVDALLASGKTIVVPADGLGTGLSQLPRRAPRLAAHIDQFFKSRSSQRGAQMRFSQNGR